MPPGWSGRLPAAMLARQHGQGQGNDQRRLLIRRQVGRPDVGETVGGCGRSREGERTCWVIAKIPCRCCYDGDNYTALHTALQVLLFAISNLSLAPPILLVSVGRERERRNGSRIQPGRAQRSTPSPASGQTLAPSPSRRSRVGDEGHRAHRGPGQGGTQERVVLDPGRARWTIRDRRGFDGMETGMEAALRQAERAGVRDRHPHGRRRGARRERATWLRASRSGDRGG